MTRIDSHQHFWRYDPAQYEWIDAQMGVLRRDFLPPDLRPLLDEQRIDQCIAVQARTTEQETDFLLTLAAEYPWIAAVIGWVDLRADDLQQRLDRWSGACKLVGFRHVLQAEVIPADGPDASFCRGVSALQKRELIYELLLRSPQLHAMAEFCRVHDSYWLVLDHLGKPNIRDRGHAEWRRDLAPIAALPHVVCKVSGMVTEAMDVSPAKVTPFDGRIERASAAFDQKISPAKVTPFDGRIERASAAFDRTNKRTFNPDDLTTYLDTTLELFGPERLMFGSDWPVCHLAAAYSQVAEIVEKWSARLSTSERDALWGDTARRVYRL